MLCSEHAAKLLRHIHPHPPGESAYCKDTCPKASVPAFGQWLEIHPANSKLRFSRYAGLAATHGLAPTLRLGLSKQEMVEIGRFRPRLSPCLNERSMLLTLELPGHECACRTKTGGLYAMRMYHGRSLHRGGRECQEGATRRAAPIMPPWTSPKPHDGMSAAPPGGWRLLPWPGSCWPT